ncbi:MAG: hypothetical protein IPO35_04085 [Uliginosibacterium sp.]|nr:hypothetical protein [Uliginosibacterium sp.]
MSAAFERFAAADGLLAELLKRVPAYEPSPRLEEAFLRFVQALPTSSASAAALPCFEPPPHMESQFLVDAKRIELAQEVRRTALLRDIADGASPAQALGAPVSPAADAWLKQHAAEVRTLPDSRPRRRRWLHFNWRDLGLATMAAALASVATHVYLSAPSASDAGEFARQASAPVHVASAESDATTNKQTAEISSRAREEKKAVALEKPLARTSTTHEAALPATTLRQLEREGDAAPPAPSTKADAKETARPAESADTNAAPAALAESMKEKADQAPPAVSATAHKAEPPAIQTPAKRATPRAGIAPRTCMAVSLESPPAAAAAQINQAACGPLQRLRANPASAISARQWAAVFRASAGDGTDDVALPLELDPDVPAGTVMIDAQP